MSDQQTHFYGDGCQPEHKHEKGACKRFTTAHATHAHDLGNVQCSNCGWYYADHQTEGRKEPE